MCLCACVCVSVCMCACVYACMCASLSTDYLEVDVFFVPQTVTNRPPDSHLYLHFYLEKGAQTDHIRLKTNRRLRGVLGSRRWTRGSYRLIIKQKIERKK